MPPKISTASEARLPEDVPQARLGSDRFFGGQRVQLDADRAQHLGREAVSLLTELLLFRPVNVQF